MGTLRERIEAARQAQQRHEQMHDVQLEIPAPEEEDDCSLENWEFYAARIGVIDSHSKSKKV